MIRNPQRPWSRLTLLGLHSAAILAALSVGFSLMAVEQSGGHAPAGIAWMGLCVLFVAILPRPWHPLGKTKPGMIVGLVLAYACVLILMLWGPNASIAAILFFALVPHLTHLPNRWRLTGYGLVTVSCLGLLALVLGRRGDWVSVFTLLPGCLATVAFTESLRSARQAMQESQKLFEGLIEAQTRLRSPATSNLVDPGTPGVAPTLSRRDLETLRLIAQGFSNREIAVRLFLAEGTIKNRVSEILLKIDARDRTNAALRARDLGLL